MLDFKTQSQLVDATATIMRCYLRAATNTFAASASRSMSLWSEMLEAASRRPASAGQPQSAARPLVPYGRPWPPGNGADMAGRHCWPGVIFWAPLADWRAWGRARSRRSRLGADGRRRCRLRRRARLQRRAETRCRRWRLRQLPVLGGHASTQVIVRGDAPSRTNGRAMPSRF